MINAGATLKPEAPKKRRPCVYYDVAHLIGMIAIGPLFLFPSGKWNVLLFAAILIWIGRSVRSGELLPSSPVNLSIAILLLVVLAGIFYNGTNEGSHAKMAGLVYGIMFFYSILEFARTERRQKAISILFVLCGAALAVLGTLGRINTEERIFGGIENILHRTPRINLGLTGAEYGINPNALGGTLLLFLPLTLILLRGKMHREKLGSKRTSIQHTTILIVAACVQSYALIMTHSWGAWAGMALSAWLLFEKKRLIPILISLMLTLILYAIILQSPKSAAINETMKIRAAYWRVGTETAKRNVLFGIGLNQLRRSGKIKYDDSHAHNQFIHTAAEIGIPGLLSYIAILIGVFWMAGEVARSSLPAWMLLNCRGLAAGQLGFAIFGLVDAVPLGAKAGLFFWISIALITSIYLYARNEGLLMKSLPETGAVSGPAISHV